MKAQEKLKLQKNMRQKCDTVSKVLKALAHPQRLLILCSLSTGEKTVGEIEQACEASQSAVSQFINRMRLEGLISSEKRGAYVYCKIADQKIDRLIQSLYKIYCG
ncbi:MAG: helix-turn-helix transcriptional regulator [Bdellovibrio sp.]|nr:helix-turn-helix transcriptional regulator [Bdellovibrio sp.]